MKRLFSSSSHQAPLSSTMSEFAFCCPLLLLPSVFPSIIEGKRRSGQQRIRWLDSITISRDMSLSKLGDSGRQRSLVCSSGVYRVTKSLFMRVKEESEKMFETQYSTNSDQGIWFHHFTANRRGKSGRSDRFYFLGLQNRFRW